MSPRNFFGKLFSRILILNLLAMLLVLVLTVVGVHYALNVYTRHDEGVKVPDLTGVKLTRAIERLDHIGLALTVNDSAYNRSRPAGVVLQQTPAAGSMVKQGHNIYVTINSTSSPSFPIPDIVDNCSAREAQARLLAIGFRLLPDKEVEGEKDWVYGLEINGRPVTAGERVSIDTPLQLLVGNGLTDGYLYDEIYDDEDSIYNEQPQNDDMP